MAQPLHYSSVIASFILALCFRVAFTSKHYDYPGLKSLHFTLYEHVTINKTAYVISKGVDTGEATSPYSLPFGSLYVFHDPLTIKPNRSSKVVGSIEGFSISSSVDGLQTTNAMQVTLSFKKHKGSISLVGAVPNIDPGDLTVVGGTGDFMFVQGYVTLSPPDHTTPPFLVYKDEFHLYWPPFATK